MDKGKAEYSDKISRFNTFYTSTTLETTTFPIQNANEFLDYQIEECTSTLASKLGSDEANKIKAVLEVVQECDTLVDGPAVGTSVVQSYNKNDGKLYTFLYSFVPDHKKKQIKADNVEISFKINIPDKFIVVRKSRTILKLFKKSWDEYQKVPPAISHETVIYSLSVAFAPFIYGSLSGPVDCIEELKQQAKETTQTTVSDYHRTIIHPMTKMNVIIEDPEILKLLPAQFIHVGGTGSAYRDYVLEM